MSDETKTAADAENATDAAVATTPPADELAMLKQRADMMGIKYHPAIGLDALKERVNVALKGEQSETEEVQSDAERRMSIREKMVKEELKLVRVRITNMNPAKKDLHGEFFCVSNKYIGDVKKFIPFGEATDDGYHIPNILLKQLKARKFQQLKTSKGRNDADIKVSRRLVNEFAIEVLPPLTQEELKQLATNQAAAQGL